MEQEIVQYLNSTYSSDNDVRTRAEEALARMDARQEFPLVLLRIASDQNMEVICLPVIKVVP